MIENRNFLFFCDSIIMPYLMAPREEWFRAELISPVLKRSFALRHSATVSKMSPFTMVHDHVPDHHSAIVHVVAPNTMVTKKILQIIFVNHKKRKNGEKINIQIRGNFSEDRNRSKRCFVTLDQ